MTLADLNKEIETIIEKSSRYPKSLSVSRDIWDEIEKTVARHKVLVTGVYLEGLRITLGEYLPSDTWIEHFDTFYIVHRPDCMFRIG